MIGPAVVSCHVCRRVTPISEATPRPDRDRYVCPTCEPTPRPQGDGDPRALSEVSE